MAKKIYKYIFLLIITLIIVFYGIYSLNDFSFLAKQETKEIEYTSDFLEEELENTVIVEKERPENVINSKKIKFITDIGDNQAYHPKIISFDKKWNGYKYWVAFTPYKEGNEEIENPCINASNNLNDWEVPNGLNNPIDKPQILDKFHYNSDTHLLYNEIYDRLELFWRYVDDKKNKVIIYQMTSKDGRVWSNKKVFLESKNRKEKDYVSPAIIFEKNKYKIWYVDKKRVYYIEKKDELLTEPKLINIKYNDELYTWHIDIYYNTKKNIYEMLTVAYKDINKRENMELYYSKSNDNLNWDKAIRIMSPSTKDNLWDSQGLYRSSMLYLNNKYYLFYSAHDDIMNVGIGLMCGKNINDLEACSREDVYEKIYLAIWRKFRKYIQ